MHQNSSAPTEHGPLTGCWTRRRYFVEEGLIQPLPRGATEEYDPFISYYGSDSTWSGRSLYLELLELDIGSEHAIEGFTSRWGLLGLYQHRLVQIRRAEADLDLSTKIDRVPEYLVEHFEAPSSTPEWVNVERWWLTREQLETDPEGAKRFFRAWLNTRKPHTVASAIVASSEGYYEELPLGDYAQRFFPHPPKLSLDSEKVFQMLRSTAQALEDDDFRAVDQIEQVKQLIASVPRLGSKWFWERLCEPVDEFRQAVEELRSVFAGCTDREDKLAVGLAMQTCTRHIRRVHPIPHFEEGALTWRWSFPSLLAAAYMMLFLDVAVEGRKLRYCEGCGKSFVADRSDKRFCGRACQNRSNQRRYRQRAGGDE